MEQTRYDFAFDRRFGPWLGMLGVRPDNSHVLVTEEALRVRFGPWEVASPLSNVTDVSVTGPYSAIKAIGVRMSLADRGLTFGSDVREGVCVRFRQPVRGSEPLGLVRHPGLTVTVADCAALADRLRRLVRTV
ncbi:hypothetical protein OUY22_01750 [Nonomuraea sp. MCN248]|uniref:SRPBCC family protein n=1 Tax=Nonomuraea corallina TaxID=2989783 RepID=A0ABT4S4J7_9ACTN|nr:hypothetical protein [Nonomuraea corallina]MDA0632124.1 hypothetical protein [Nonomuraea corallina]